MLEQEIQATLRQLERLKSAMQEKAMLVHKPKRHIGQIQECIDTIRRLKRLDYKSKTEIQLDAVELALQSQRDERLLEMRSILLHGKSLTTEQEQYLLRIA